MQTWRPVLGVCLCIATLFPIALSGPRYSSRIVDTEAGAIRGIILELNSRHLEPVEAFLGVPYAAPPVGENRFNWASRPLPWEGTRLADTMAPVCPQLPPDIENQTAALELMPRARYFHLMKLVPLLANQSEDCLHLNLYIPASGSRGLEAPYAVLVFVHGESYEWNSGNPYDGSVLASYGHVIVVTVNYRLGILGFLRLEQEERSAAQSDIEAALQWVKHNVGAFGGDPTRITVVGHGHGATIANLLLLSPTAKGLFRRVVLLSGSVLSPWAVVQQPEVLRVSVAGQLGCPPTGRQLLACLRHLSLEALLSVRISPPRFLPGYGPWVHADPLLLLETATDHFVTTDLLLATTTTESYLDFSAHDIEYGIEEEDRNKILRTYVRNAYYYHLNEIFSTIRNEYTDWEKPIIHPINIRDSTLEALSDGHTVAPLLRVAHLHARRGATTYFLHFGYQSKDGDYIQRLGSVRGDDLPYILGHPLVGGMPHFSHNYTRQDIVVSETLLSYFTNFAKTGDPNERRSGDVDKTRHRTITWEPYTPSTQFYLSLIQRSRLKNHYRGHKIAVWLNLIPQLHQPGDEDVSMRHHHFHEKDSHYYAGIVRAESFTKKPIIRPLPPVQTTPISSVECVVLAPTNNSVLIEESTRSADDESIQHFVTGHTAALGAIGCLLLVLNLILFFAAVFYHRHRRRRSKRPCMPEEGDLALPCYGKNISLPQLDPPPPPKIPPVPPVRTSSNPPSGTLKKRVQIQEIPV
ncbi:neuroligin-1-like [Lycorma delicatula]|uniref:neuroligin-1-like n=1 Tax=Lycorma delicatula TaxID=130591 RepID=UPI003F50F5F0